MFKRTDIRNGETCCFAEGWVDIDGVEMRFEYVIGGVRSVEACSAEEGLVEMIMDDDEAIANSQYAKYYNALRDMAEKVHCIQGEEDEGIGAAEGGGIFRPDIVEPPRNPFKH